MTTFLISPDYMVYRSLKSSLTEQGCELKWVLSMEEGIDQLLLPEQFSLIICGQTRDTNHWKALSFLILQKKTAFAYYHDNNFSGLELNGNDNWHIININSHCLTDQVNYLLQIQNPSLLTG